MGPKPSRQRPLLSICMIVRDEEANLPRALASVRGLADELIVVDTGSTDGTVRIAQSFGARVLSFPWTGDFSAARNAGLAAARGEWVMVLDADEELLAEDRPQVRRLLQAAEAAAFICPVTSLLGGPGNPDYERSFLLRFWRNHPQHRYTGLMHEDISPSIFAQNPDARLIHAPVRFVHYGYLEAAEEGKAKRARNIALIEREVERNPDSHFYRFNLGVEYQRHHRFAEAVAQYQQARTAATGTPWEPKLVKNLIYCLLSVGRWDDAAQEIQAGLQRFPDFTDLLYFRGIVEVQRQEYARAAGSFSQCVAMGPASVPPYAGAEEGLGAWKALYALGQAYQGAGRLQDAVGAYEQAYTLRPEWLSPLQATVRVLLGAGVDGERVQGYVAERLPQGVAHRPLVIADLLYQGGAPEAALGQIPADLDLSGEAAAWATYLRGYCRLKLGRWAEAAADLQAVPPGDQHRPAALAGLAYCHWCEGNVEAMEAALAALGENEAARLQGARLFIDAAKDVLAKGLARFPDSGPLQTLLERIGREAL